MNNENVFKKFNDMTMKPIQIVILFYLIIWMPINLSAQSKDRPNVIFVMPDDISHSAFSYYKENGPRTPNIDMLAEESVRLTDFHVSPSCSPTRAALLTGRPSDV